MYKAFGIVNPCGKNIWVDGLQKHRPIGSFSFLGRYRVVDFPISNLSNSGIDRIQVYVGNKPRSIVEHITASTPRAVRFRFCSLMTVYRTACITQISLLIWLTWITSSACIMTM